MKLRKNVTECCYIYRVTLNGEFVEYAYVEREDTYNTLLKQYLEWRIAKQYEPNMTINEYRIKFDSDGDYVLANSLDEYVSEGYCEFFENKTLAQFEELEINNIKL